MLYLLAFVLLFQGKTLHIDKPKPIEPVGVVDESGQITLRNDALICRVKALDPKALMARIKDSGISPEIYEDEKIQVAFAQMLAFDVEIENISADQPLTFHPEHVLLTTHKNFPVGIQVRVADYWPTTEPLGDENWEKFAELFSRTSANIVPGGKTRQMIVFRPIRKSFDGKIHLQIDRIYSGVLTNKVVCQFEAGTSKE